ncbi:MAG TPA: hypothetical protein VJL58_03160 [Pyrinomonadaceae bacterium]|nr:hypothetical protein [Pyrinomonadaceae bacterium]
MTLRLRVQRAECERCGRMVDGFTPDQIAGFLNVPQAEVPD